MSLAFHSLILSAIPVFDYNNNAIYEATVTKDDHWRSKLQLTHQLTNYEIGKIAAEEESLFGFSIKDFLFFKNPSNYTNPTFTVSTDETKALNDWADIYLSKDSQTQKLLMDIPNIISKYVMSKIGPELLRRILSCGISMNDNDAEFVRYIKSKQITFTNSAFDIIRYADRFTKYMDRIIRNEIKRGVIEKLKQEELDKDSEQSYINHELCKDSLQAFINTRTTKFFPMIFDWQNDGKNMFQPAIDLWECGMIPSYYYGAWSLMTDSNIIAPNSKDSGDLRMYNINALRSISPFDAIKDI
jgi:hypothetical protein